jgi:hypothetical protein
LIQKCRPKPTVSRTPTGGSRIAKITRMMFNLRLHGAWGGCCHSTINPGRAIDVPRIRCAGRGTLPSYPPLASHAYAERS